MRRAVLILVAGFALVCAPAVAHHTFSEFYLESDSIEVEGTVVEFQYRNPHAWLHVEGREGASTEVKIYSAEWVGTSQLEREGIGRNFFSVGDRVRIWGSPARKATDTRMHLKRVRRADGWEWRPRRPATR